jgi:hypothetical protein
MPHDNFAFDRQLPNHFVFFDIALHSHNRSYRLQFRNDRQNREVTCVDNQFNSGKMLPYGFGKFFEVWDMCIGDDSYMMLQFGAHLSFGVYYMCLLLF